MGAPMQSFRCLTDIETLGLQSKYGLADGHAYQDLSDSQELIISRLPQLWKKALVGKQRAIEVEFHENFYRLAGQQSMIGSKDFRICTSASQSIDMVGAYLFRNQIKVGLIHPTFDNLAQIMNRWKLAPIAIDESAFFSQNPQTAFDPNQIDALFLVNPNNPTGQFLTPQQAELLIAWCKDNRKTLIIDQTFRFFDPHPFDLSALLLESGISFILIEDTGKTFPTLDMKASILAYSNDLAEKIETVYEEIFLGVSPFALLILNEFILDAIHNGLENVVLKKVRAHRQILNESLSGTIFHPLESKLELPVQWVKIQNTSHTDSSVVHEISKSGLVILPGSPFFWNQPSEGNSFVRISLLKPISIFQPACHLLRQELLKMELSHELS
jgi:aspartate/methionine/tyrosine aminotransferase